MVSVFAECVCAMQTTQAVHVTVLWTSSPVWPVMGKSVMAVAPATVVCVSAPTLNSRVPLVRFAPLVLECVQSTSEYRKLYFFYVIF